MMGRVEIVQPSSPNKEHLSGYARRDWQVVDYQIEELGTTGLSFRGPQPRTLEPGTYFACLGAAQTFGCFCEKPFPALLEAKLQVAALNLGYGGAGPSFFLKHNALLDYVNGASFAIVQVMSGRSESNSLFDSGGLEYLTRRSDGSRIGATPAYQKLLADDALWSLRLGGRVLYFHISPPARTREIVAETRANWTRNTRRLLEAIEVPTILFYFSRRPVDYQERYYSAPALLGDFPQLVNASMIAALRGGSDAYVECVTSRGSPQLLVDRFTGKPTTVDLSLDRPDFRGTWKRNLYYPSPEMHSDAAAALEPVCRQMLNRRTA